jgi:CYTH domain-containing protein
MGVAKLTDQNTIVPAQSKYARVERERRYLLQDLPEGLTRADPHVQITDNYITGTRLRLRKVRDPKTIDMFLGDLFGLVLAEVTFKSDAEMDNFPLPSFALAEVTNDKTFSGGRLSEVTFGDIRDDVLRYARARI